MESSLELRIYIGDKQAPTNIIITIFHIHLAIIDTSKIKLMRTESLAAVVTAPKDTIVIEKIQQAFITIRKHNEFVVLGP